MHVASSLPRGTRTVILHVHLGYLWSPGSSVDKDIYPQLALSPVHVGCGTFVCCTSITHVYTPLLLTRHPWGFVSVAVGTVTLDVHSCSPGPFWVDVTVFFLARICFLFLAVLPFNSLFYFSIFHSSNFYLYFTSHPFFPSEHINPLPTDVP